jgi:hypothetical protein
VPHRLVERDIDLSQSVRVTNLAPDSRITLDGDEPAARLVLANRVQGSFEIPFAYAAHEHVDNGDASRRDSTETRKVSVQAPGYLPRVFDVVVPGPHVIDAQLQQSVLASITVSEAAERDFDVVLDSIVSGRCDEAAELLERATARATTHEARRMQHALERCNEMSILEQPTFDWDPASIGVPSELASSPVATITALQTLMTQESDAAGRAGLDRIIADVEAGRLVDAARIASLVAAPLPSRRAALVLRLPAALLAAQRLRDAQAALAQSDSLTALQLASEARHIDPLVEPLSYMEIRAARVSALVAQGASAEQSDDPLLARAYFRAAAALSPGATEPGAGLARTANAAESTVRFQLAVMTSGAGAAVMQNLVRMMPRHVALTPNVATADAVLSVFVSEPQREHRVTKSVRTKEVTIGSVTRANPDYADAVSDVKHAEHQLEEAKAAQQKMHEQAVETARQASESGGWAGVIGGVVSGAAEGGGAYLVVDAEGDLRGARAKLARTPRTTTETVKADASYEALRIDTTAKTRLVVRLDGLGDPIEEATEVTASSVSEQVLGDPEIDVDDSAADLRANEQVTPDLRSAVNELAQRLAARVAAVEEQSAWSEFAAQRDRGDIEGASAAADAYLEVVADPRAHFDELVKYIVENLP